MKNLFVSVAIIMLSCVSCKEQYLPPVESLQDQLLVVEANLDAGGGPTTVRLSRTTKLDNASSIKVENNATVFVEGKDNTTQTLSFTGSGNYFSSNLNMVINNEYRLRIRTSSGKEYLSDYVKALYNPPLDSINWERTNDGVQIYVNTNDPANVLKYFRWDFIETWEIRSFYYSNLIFVNGNLRSRVFPAENIRDCWKTSPSTQILLANSTQLQSGIISKAPIQFIPVNDEKLLIRYSIIAKQYALEKGGYNFFEILKKNTENIGSLFGPQPSELKGNIKCLTQPDEPVIGFVTASGVTEKRIFISNGEVAPWHKGFFCREDSIASHRDSIIAAVGGGLVPITYLDPPINRYLFSTPFCVDCTSRGATNIKPLFW
ncbi:MAG TPA: DUF4249 domain-containing protein [Chitinophagaceae bacterium]